MASSLTQLLDTYSVSHQNPTNQKIHKVAVPLIMFSILGLSSLVVIGTVKLSWLMILLAGLYYLQFKKLKVFLIIYAQVIAMMLIIQANPFSTVWFYLTVFILAFLPTRSAVSTHWTDLDFQRLALVITQDRPQKINHWQNS
jgi:uncharacterized membrane protein YGL010W